MKIADPVFDSNLDSRLVAVCEGNGAGVFLGNSIAAALTGGTQLCSVSSTTLRSCSIVEFVFEEDQWRVPEVIRVETTPFGQVIKTELLRIARPRVATRFAGTLLEHLTAHPRVSAIFVEGVPPDLNHVLVCDDGASFLVASQQFISNL